MLSQQRSAPLIRKLHKRSGGEEAVQRWRTRPLTKSSADKKIANEEIGTKITVGRGCDWSVNHNSEAGKQNWQGCVIHNTNSRGVSLLFQGGIWLAQR